MFVKCNVTIPEDWTRVWDEAERTLGGKIHLLLNNAGINPTVIGFFNELGLLYTALQPYSQRKLFTMGRYLWSVFKE